MASSDIAARPSRLEMLGSFIAPPILRRLAGDPKALDRPLPLVERGPSAVLFADISGFTPLTERLGQRGPAGVEDLSRVLNAYFSRLIDGATAHGGEVVQFAGDALLALWPSTPDALAETTLRAAVCALELQRAVAGFQTDDGSTLALRASVGAGDVMTAHVGGVNGRRELFIAGPPLSQVGVALGLAKAGEVSLCAEAHAAVRDRVRGRACEGGALIVASVPDPPAPRPLAQLPVPAEAAARLLEYLPHAVRSHLDTRSTEWLAELRRLTVLFVNLGELDQSSPPERTQEVLAALQTEIQHFAGNVKELSADEKGSTLVATLGLPPQSHEDDPLRGVQAALAIRDRLTALGLRSAIGVATGRVFCGIVGTPVRREYTIAGGVTTFAARLMQAAGKGPGLLCDGATVRATAGAVEYQELPALQLKGKERPVPVYRPLAASAGPARHTGRWKAVAGPVRHSGRWTAIAGPDEIVGRAAECAALAEVLDALVSGEPRDECLGLAIEGPAGCGKTRLLEHLCERARAQDVRVVASAGSGIEAGTPYYAWRDLCRGLLGLEEAESTPDARRAAAVQHVEGDADAERLLPLLEDVFPLGLPENEHTAGLSGEARADNTRRLLRRLVAGAAAPGPLVLAVDATQWLDYASWEALLTACRKSGRVLVAVVGRPAEGGAAEAWATFVERPETHRLEVGPLAASEVELLACRHLQARGLGASLAELICDKSGGNPLYVEELATGLFESGLIRVEDGVFDLVRRRAADEVRIPTTLEGLVTERLDRLEPTRQLALKTASVIGPRFSLRLTRDIFPLEEERPRIPAHLESLANEKLTRRAPERGEPAYEFRDTVTREVAYNLLSFRHRRQLHRRIAESWESRGPIEAPALFPLLAHHWRHADEPARAIDYLERAGEAAMRGHASYEAVRSFETATALAERVEGEVTRARRARWWRQLGTARLAIGDIEQARDRLLRALDDLDLPASGGPLRMVLRLAGALLRQVLHRLRPSWFLGRGASRRESLLEALRAYEPLTQVYFFGHARVHGVHAAFASLNLAESAGSSAELSRAYTRTLIAAGLAPLHRLARLYERLAFASAERAGDEWTHAYVLEASAVYRAGAGDLAEAGDRLERARARFDALGDHRHADECTSNLAIVRHHVGRFAEALDLARAVEASGVQRRDTQVEAWGLLGQARNHLPRGETEAALDAITRAHRLLARRQSPLDHATFIEERALRGLAELRRGRLSEARAAAQEALSLVVSKAPVTYYTAHVAPSIAEVFFALLARARTESAPRRERAALEAAARGALHQLRRFARVFALGEPIAHVWHAAAEQMRGRPARAHKAVDRALRAAERLGMPYEYALALREKARLLEPGDPAHAEATARARAAFEALGAAFDTAPVDRLGTGLQERRSS